MAGSSIIPLADAPTGRPFVVRQLRGGKDFLSRIAALGFTEGVQVEVIQNFGQGPLIILVRGVRVALGRGEAVKVLVREAGNDPKPPQSPDS